MGNFHWRQAGGWCNTCLHVNVVVGQRQRKQIVQVKPWLFWCVVHSCCFLHHIWRSVAVSPPNSFRQHSQPWTCCCQAPYLLLSCLSPVYGKLGGLKLPRHGCGKLVMKSSLGWSRHGAAGVHIHKAQVEWTPMWTRRRSEYSSL